jgi:hypothetical protein
MKLLSLAFAIAAVALAQEHAAAPQSHTDAAKTHETEEKEAIEAEFVASDIFRSGTLIVPVYKKLTFEGHYFGGVENNVGYTGASYAFRFGGLLLAPGFGVAFGAPTFTTSPALSFRWDYQHRWFVTQGMMVQSFRDVQFKEESHHSHSTEEAVKNVRPTITDGNHVSARVKRITVGGTWEHIQFRETEWKYGGRLQVRLLSRVSGVMYVLTPGRTEWRGGILIHAPERD